MSHEAIQNDDESFQCLDCDKLYSLSALRLHRNKVHKQNKVKCNECDQTFSFNSWLEKHILIHHPTSEYLKSVSSQCEECKQMFKSADVLDQHQLTCLENPLSFPCKDCSSKWASATSLKKHYAEHHSKAKEVCKICGWATFIGGLSFHMKKLHTGERKYSCEHCQKRFASMPLL